MSGPTPYAGDGKELFTEERPAVVILGDLLEYIQEMRKLYDDTQELYQVLQDNLSFIGSGSPKGVYPTLSVLQQDFPNGDSHIYVTTDNGNWYYWNGSAWTSGGVYQATQLANNSVPVNALQDYSITLNKVDDDSRKIVEYINNKINDLANEKTFNFFQQLSDITIANGTSSLVDEVDKKPNSTGKSVKFSFTNATTSHFSVQNIPISDKPVAMGMWFKKSQLASFNNLLEIYPTLWYQNTAGTTVYNTTMDGLNGSPVVKANNLTKVGTKFKYLKDGITLTFESLSEIGDYIYWTATTDSIPATVTKARFFITIARKSTALDLNVFDPKWTTSLYRLLPNFTQSSTSVSYPNNKYVGKSVIGLGDSIMWQDGKAFSGTSELAIGYLTNLKNKLNFSSILNGGISGRPMANNTANGVGTNTTGKTFSYVSQDVVLINAGTNDFKLNVPLGSKGVIGDTSFDTNTFYGAYRDLIEYILKEKPSIKIVLMTPLQRDNGSYDVNTTNTVGHKLINYVDAVKAIGEMYAIPTIDMYGKSGLTKLNLSIYTLDGLHPNNLGYQRISDYLCSQFVVI